MHINRIALILVTLLALASPGVAQRAEVTVSLNEQFLDALLDAIFKSAGPPEFSIANNSGKVSKPQIGAAYSSSLAATRELTSACPDSVRLLRDINGVRTAVRFRDGKIFAPLAFSGAYAPPFVGCVEFSGVADTSIDLEFDQANQRLVARAVVSNVNLSGTGGVGGTVVAKMIQTTIDRKVNPIELMKLDKISFTVPIQNSGSMRMKAVGVRNEIVNDAVNVHITYEFFKG